MAAPTSIPAPNIQAYHFWSFLSVTWFRSTRPLQGSWPISTIQWWLVRKANAAYPPEHRRIIGGLPE